MIKNLKNKKKKGFTLIELIIVIAIIAILAAIAIPKFGEVRKKANVSADISNAKQIQSAVSVVTAEGTVALPATGVTTEILYDGTSDTTDKDTTGIENAIKNQLQGAVPKLKAENKGNYFYVEVSDTGVVTIKTQKSGGQVIYPQPASGTYAE